MSVVTQGLLGHLEVLVPQPRLSGPSRESESVQGGENRPILMKIERAGYLTKGPRRLWAKAICCRANTIRVKVVDSHLGRQAKWAKFTESADVLDGQGL